MKDNEPPVIDAALLGLLRFDAARDAQPAAKARLLGRLESTLGPLGGATSPTTSATVARGDHSSALDSALLARTRGARPAARLTSAWSLAGKPVGTIAAAFLLGGAGGAGLWAALAPPKVQTFYVEHPIAVSEPRPFAFESVNTVQGLANREVDVAEPAKARSNPTPVVSGLAAERELLDGARKALARGDTPEAERALNLHARRHPAGLLLEEREALAIKVLVDLGRLEDARRRAGKFKERYPRSLFGPSVEEAIGTIR
jgi:hypothetical protein